eukprot:7303604-Pyramimonas_sp.AAC.1
MEEQVASLDAQMKEANRSGALSTGTPPSRGSPRLSASADATELRARGFPKKHVKIVCERRFSIVKSSMSDEYRNKCQ